MLAPPEAAVRFYALDVETANNWNGSICQIGVAAVREDGTITTASSLIDPRCDFDRANIKLHGITPEDVSGQPTFLEAMAVLEPILAGFPIVQHSRFDENAIKAAYEDLGLRMPKFRWIDSVQIARRAWPEFLGNGGHGLAHLKMALGLTFNHHDAGEDARAAAMVVLLAEQETGRSFKDLAAVRSSPVYAPGGTIPKSVTRTGNPLEPMAGVTIVFSGTLETMSRDDAADLAAARGATVKASVTAKTDILVLGDQDLSLLAGHSKSSKHRKAEELIAGGQRIRIMCERDFINMLSAATGSPTAPGPQAAPEQAVVTIVFAGRLRTMTTAEAASRCKAIGAMVVTSIGRDVTYVVAGEGPGHKLILARKLGVTVLDEAAFVAILQER